MTGSISDTEYPMGSIEAVSSRLRLLPMVDFGRERIFRVPKSKCRIAAWLRGRTSWPSCRESKTLITHTTIRGKASMR